MRFRRQASEPLRYAIAGAGSAGRFHWQTIGRDGGVALVAVADPSPPPTWQVRPRGGSTLLFPDARRMIDETRPELVSVCTPPAHHHLLALHALRAGAHVACEKPLALDLAQAHELERARAEAGVLGLVNFKVRDVPAIRRARELVAGGGLGPIVRVAASYLQSFRGHPTARWSWRSDAAVAGFGSLGELGVHAIDTVRFVTGLEFVRVAAGTQARIASVPDATGAPKPVTTETDATVLAELGGGVSATLETSQVAGGYGDLFRLEIGGTEAALHLSSEEPDTIVVFPAAADTAPRLRTEPRVEAVPERLRDPALPASPASILRAIRGEQIAYPTFADGVAAQCVLEAIVGAARDGVWTAVPAA
jgi:predicted dehydrogenase